MLIYVMIALALYKLQPDGFYFIPYSRNKSETSITRTPLHTSDTHTNKEKYTCWWKNSPDKNTKSRN